MSDPMFSIIVPAYNAAKHIRKLLDSVAGQTFRNFELIVVCDSCVDKTEQIAKSYGAITDNVHYERDGLTRDRGLEIAKGAWILFADDDDWFINEHAFQHLADALTGQDIDMLAFGYECNTKGYIPPAEENILKPCVDHVWSSAWRRSSIRDARFGNARFCSDTYFLKGMRANVRKHALLDMPIYYYNFMRPLSQTDLFCKGLIKQSPIAR